MYGGHEAVDLNILVIEWFEVPAAGFWLRRDAPKFANRCKILKPQ